MCIYTCIAIVIAVAIAISFGTTTAYCHFPTVWVGASTTLRWRPSATDEHPPSHLEADSAGRDAAQPPKQQLGNSQ